MTNPDRAEIAGWLDNDGTWYNVEDGERYPDADDLAEANVEVTVSYRDEDDIVHYWTIYGPFDDDYSWLDAIDELGDVYGVE